MLPFLVICIFYSSDEKINMISTVRFRHSMTTIFKSIKIQIWQLFSPSYILCLSYSSAESHMKTKVAFHETRSNKFFV